MLSSPVFVILKEKFITNDNFVIIYSVHTDVSSHCLMFNVQDASFQHMHTSIKSGQIQKGKEYHKSASKLMSVLYIHIL